MTVSAEHRSPTVIFSVFVTFSVLRALSRRIQIYVVLLAITLLAFDQFENLSKRNTMRSAASVFDEARTHFGVFFRAISMNRSRVDILLRFWFIENSGPSNTLDDPAKLWWLALVMHSRLDCVSFARSSNVLVQFYLWFVALCLQRIHNTCVYCLQYIQGLLCYLTSRILWCFRMPYHASTYFQFSLREELLLAPVLKYIFLKGVTLASTNTRAQWIWSFLSINCK